MRRSRGGVKNTAAEPDIWVPSWTGTEGPENPGQGDSKMGSESPPGASTEKLSFYQDNLANGELVQTKKRRLRTTLTI